jgi:Tfp pilus assembly protein PilF
MKEERIRKLNALLELDPHDSFARYALAMEYAGANDTVQAMTMLENLKLSDPSYVPTYQQLGYLYEKSGRREEAATVLKLGIQIAAQQNDNHARSEMQEALESLEP